MYVRITSPVEDNEAKRMYNMFKQEGRCPVTLEDVHMGVLRDAREEGGNYVLTVEITNLAAIRYLRSMQTA
jgi:hypothetical protein